MAREPRHQIAICYLLLKGEHWIPVSPDRRLTAIDRSSPDGPVIMAEVIGEVEDNRVSGWRKVGSLIQEVGPDGKVAPLDTRLPAAIMGALLSDGAASARGVVHQQSNCGAAACSRGADNPTSPLCLGACAR